MNTEEAIVEAKAIMQYLAGRDMVELDAGTADPVESRIAKQVVKVRVRLALCGMGCVVDFLDNKKVRFTLK